MGRYLGIEAGATRTVAMAAGPDLARPICAEFGPANLYLLDDRQLARHLRAIARAMPCPDTLCIGMAGARTDVERARVRAAAARAWPGVPCYATNDLETALMAADTHTPTDHLRAPGRRPIRRRAPARPPGRGAPRVLVVSGTGSCCFGRAPDGRTVRLGGWGHVLGDRGSGYDIALGALKAVIFAGDRTGTWPPLGRRILRTLALNEPADLVGWVQRASKADIAALALEVFRASDDRDRMAANVLDRAAQTLAEDAAACARRVTRPGTLVQFVLAGSVLLRQPRFAGAVRRAIRRLWPDAVVSPLKRDSVWGAVELARRHLGPTAPACGPPVSTLETAVRRSSRHRVR